MLTMDAHTTDDLTGIARQIISQFSGKRVFALQGLMGAGKTTLIKYLCNELGVGDVVVSPTFALVNEYKTKDSEPVYHFDFYRINSLSEAYDIGYEEYFYSGSYCFIEWPEKIGQLLPPGCVYISILPDQDQKRIITAR